MPVDIALLDLERASQAELLGQFELARAAFAVDRPDAPPPTFDEVVDRLRMRPAGIGRKRLWTAHDTGEVVGLAVVLFPEAENTGLAVMELRVHPRSRNRGVATRLLQEVLPILRAENRQLVTGMGVTAGGDGERWAAAWGFTTVQGFVLQVLTIADVDPATWRVPVPAGYRLERWRGTAPEALLASYAEARSAIHDAPTGESSYRQPEWTPERVRAAEEEARRRGAELSTVVAVHEATGAVAGLTEIETHPGQPDLAFQADTAVLAGHRGRGLGRTVKAAMTRWLVAEKPGIARVATTTDAGNVHMISVNHQVGYRTTRTMIDVEAPLATLEAELRKRSHADWS
ncbi:GNAT family N-acetyltransferase [Planobispora takensis]|uniref:N-acetyltransferase domain-containing protein n=1 Tax=Planobispora takensis TaxID=1367882 RepID=A0A8J3SSS7_9ACTN|nr:GNAT family N-acetyltransferase [Planobispora takensis]GIH98202.1 hypothetical protein Pta02_02110 [Planobispora takensis]